MAYEQLKHYFAEYHAGLLTKSQLGCAIHMWQRHGARHPGRDTPLGTIIIGPMHPGDATLDDIIRQLATKNLSE